MLVLFRNYHQLILKGIVCPVQTLLLMFQAWNNASLWRICYSKFLSAYFGLWGIPNDVLNYMVEAFASCLPKLWTESLNWIAQLWGELVKTKNFKNLFFCGDREEKLFLAWPAEVMRVVWYNQTFFQFWRKMFQLSIIRVQTSCIVPYKTYRWGTWVLGVTNTPIFHSSPILLTSSHRHLLLCIKLLWGPERWIQIFRAFVEGILAAALCPLDVEFLKS